MANECADALAAEGSAWHSLPPACAEATVFIENRVAKILARAAAIAQDVCSRPVDPARVISPPPPPPPVPALERRRIALAATTHTLHSTPRRFLCLRCLTKAPARAANAWLMCVCPGAPAPLEQGGGAPSHPRAGDLLGQRAVFGRRCGAWTTWAFRNLARPCRDNPPPFFAYALRRLERGLPPIPPPARGESHVLDVAPAPAVPPPPRRAEGGVLPPS